MLNAFGRVFSLRAPATTQNTVSSVKDITEALWGTCASPSTLNELNQKGYPQIDDWRNKPIQGGEKGRESFFCA